MINERPTHCPFVNRTDSRCSTYFTLDHLQHAFKYCFGSFKTCSLYAELLMERQFRRAAAKEVEHVQATPYVQISVARRERESKTRTYARVLT